MSAAVLFSSSGRDGMLPPALGWVAPRTGTPLVALVAELALGWY